ncbi:peptidylprolyl isomerase [Alteromonas pelagimontana]|uniref:Peptidyl-prolyl cis-trans isomerase n=1 Tax=Alteromonas pelagimontana TaxID=1858656 RepID=A0A6M4MDT3_9ALTE|nr:FKBP-type peptidyl-prolyl cis-trans isomerase [Alteromonas pelagimontana]QJR81263.1 peptidylprolyl isomerase [Alteromonas pelagimontana]
MGKQKQKKLAKGSAGQNRNLTADFLVKYQNKEDVHGTESGLLFRIIDNSAGESPSLNHVVKVHQRILLADGTVIDDTYRKGLPEEFPLKEAIDGLKEGLQLMPAGARYEFVIPPELAWDKKGNGGKIGPNVLMVVDIRLLSFEELC